MSEKSTYPYEVEVCVLNKEGLLTPMGYQRAIITATEKELRRIGLSVPEMITRFNVTWILLSLSVEIYKPIKEVLRKTKFIRSSSENYKFDKKSLLLTICGLALIVACLLIFVFVMDGNLQFFKK